MSLVLRERHDAGLSIELVVREVLFRKSTQFQDVLIGETEAFGLGLFLDDAPQSFASDEGVYHTALVQPAMFLHPNPRRVLIAGGGEGATLREVLRHPDVERATMVDIDGELVAACRTWLPAWSAGAFDDPRAELVHADVVAWLADQPAGAWDVVILDLGDPTAGSPAQFAYTREFYAQVARVLAPDGVVATQACELDLAATHDYRAVKTTMEAAFGHLVPYACFVPSFFAYWGFALAARVPLRDPAEAMPEIEARWARAGGAAWKHFEPATLPHLLYLPPGLRRRLARPGQTITADAPLTVYDERTTPDDELEDAQ